MREREREKESNNNLNDHFGYYCVSKMMDDDDDDQADIRLELPSFDAWIDPIHSVVAAAAAEDDDDDRLLILHWFRTLSNYSISLNNFVENYLNFDVGSVDDVDDDCLTVCIYWW